MAGGNAWRPSEAGRRGVSDQPSGKGAEKRSVGGEEVTREGRVAGVGLWACLAFMTSTSSENLRSR